MFPPRGIYFGFAVLFRERLHINREPAAKRLYIAPTLEKRGQLSKVIGNDQTSSSIDAPPSPRRTSPGRNGGPPASAVRAVRRNRPPREVSS